MSRQANEEEREERIQMEIIVDAYTRGASTWLVYVSL